jgi:hypothetical protein
MLNFPSRPSWGVFLPVSSSTSITERYSQAWKTKAWTAVASAGQIWRTKGAGRALPGERHRRAMQPLGFRDSARRWFIGSIVVGYK